MGSVEVVVLRGHPVLKGNLMFAHDRVQFQDPLPFSILIQGPLGDVDVMSAPIGQVTFLRAPIRPSRMIPIAVRNLWDISLLC